MTIVHRVLSPEPVLTLEDYVRRRGGGGVEAARLVGAEALISELEASGLRGRGGAGFPTGRKWRTVVENRSSDEPTTVVVNGAEGEPGTFKDRSILRTNPYPVIEGALIAASVVGAATVVFGLKASFGTEVRRMRAAIAEVEAAGWADGVELVVFEGPDEYLYGEETAMLECIDGRHPFPRLAPPYRRGVSELVETADDVASHSGQAAHVEMAAPGTESDAPPTLVDNVETMANVPRIIERGAAWFRTEGTAQSPGTIVCTVTGSVRHPGVGELIMGTTLGEAIELIGGGAREGRTIKAVLPGVSAGLVPASLLNTPLTYEDMAAIGSGLGSGGFIVLDDQDDLTALAAGASRFLAVESCGQCTPCKQDGVALSGLLAKLARSEATDIDRATIDERLATVTDGARCYLATQQQAVVSSILAAFPAEVDEHLTAQRAAAEPMLIAEVVDIDGATVVTDEHHLDKQPDWTYDAEDSGRSPADRLDDHRAEDPPGG